MRTIRLALIFAPVCIKANGQPLGESREENGFKSATSNQNKKQAHGALRRRQSRTQLSHVSEVRRLTRKKQKKKSSLQAKTKKKRIFASDARPSASDL